MERPTASEFARFKRAISPDEASGCWLWTGEMEGRYGKFRYGGRRPHTDVVGAHRFAFMVWKFIPFGLSVLHRCDVPACVNPGYLFLGTQADNVADMMAKGRHRFVGRPLANSLKTHCRHGHPLSGANLWVRKDGSRICKSCRARIARNWRKSQ